MKKRVVTLLRILVSAGLLYWLLRYKVPWEDVWNNIVHVNPWILLIPLLLHIVGYWISSKRWQLLLRAQGIDTPVGFLIGSYIVGTFFNNFLPTTVGGDVVRAYDTARFSRKGVKSATVVVVERLTGIFALVVIALLALLVEWRFMKHLPTALWVFLVVMSAAFAALALLLTPGVVSTAGRFFERLGFTRLQAKLKQVYEAVSVYREKKAALRGAILWSFALQVNVIVHYWLIGVALGMEVNPLHFFAFIPILIVILMIPAFINGIGAREAVCAYLFSLVGVSEGKAVALGVLSYFLILICGVIGGILYAIRKERKAAAHL